MTYKNQVKILNLTGEYIEKENKETKEIEYKFGLYDSDIRFKSKGIYNF